METIRTENSHKVKKCYAAFKRIFYYLLLSQNLPHFRYSKIAENEFSKESLMATRNLVSRLFLIETSRVEELADIIVDVLKILKKEVNKELQRDSGLWVHQKNASCRHREERICQDT